MSRIVFYLLFPHDTSHNSPIANVRAAWIVAALSRDARRLRSWRRSWLGVFLLQEVGGEVEGGGVEDVGSSSFWKCWLSG